MNKKIVRNFLLFLVIFASIITIVSCPTTPINKTVTITFSGDEHVLGITVNNGKSNISVVDNSTKYSQKAGETLSFKVETDPLYMVKSISGQVGYYGGKNYTITPSENTEVKIETIRRVGSSSSILSVRGDSGVEVATFNSTQALRASNETSSQTRIVSDSTAFFEKDGSGTLIIRPKSGYKIETVRSAVLKENNEYTVSEKASNVIITTSRDPNYVNPYKTIVINNGGGEGETSVIFYKDGKFYSDNKEGSSEITSITPPTYGEYVISFSVEEENVVIDKGEGVEGETISDDFTLSVRNNFKNIVSPNGDEAIDASGNINSQVTPFYDCVEYKALWETEEVSVPLLRQNFSSPDEYTKRFVGWGLKRNDDNVDLKAEDGKITISYTPSSSLTLYDKWVNESYALKIEIEGENNGKVLIGRDGEDEYKNGDEFSLSKRQDLIFRIAPNESYTYTYSLRDTNSGSDIKIDGLVSKDGIYEYSFGKENVNKYSSLTLKVKFGRFAEAELSGKITLVKDVEINNENLSSLPRLTLTVDGSDSTHDTWDQNKLKEKVDITDKVFVTSSQVPLTQYGETLKAYLTYGGEKNAIVSIEGTPKSTLGSDNNVISITSLPMSYLTGVSDSDSLTIKASSLSSPTLVVKDSVTFTFSPSSDANNIKNKFNKIVVDKTNLIKERTFLLSGSDIQFVAEKDTNLVFVPLFETGYALDTSSPFESNVKVQESGDKFVIYSSEYNAIDKVAINVVSREKSIVVNNIDVVDKGLKDYNVGDNASKTLTIELKNNGYERASQVIGVEPVILVLVNENSVDKWVNITDTYIGGVGFSKTYNSSDFTITLCPARTLTLPLLSTSLKIVIPSKAFVGETSDVEVLYKDNKPEIPFMIYPSVVLSGSGVSATNISSDRIKNSGQISLSSESALNSEVITEEGYDITEYVSIGDAKETLSSYGLKATLFSDKTEGEENTDVETGYISITGTAIKSLSESLLNFSLPAKLFKGFENDEKTLKSSSSAKLNILKTVSITFASAEDTEDGHKNKLSSVIISDSETLNGETLENISSAEGKKKSVYTISEEAIRFSLTFEKDHALDNLNPFSPKELVGKVSSDADETDVYEISGTNLKEDTTLTITSTLKTVALESTTLDSYSVGDDSVKKSEFILVASGYTLPTNFTTVAPNINVITKDRNGNEQTLPITSKEVGGVGFNVSFVKQNENTFKLTLSPSGEITSSLTASKIKITIPKEAFTNADSDVEVSGLDDESLVVYPRFEASDKIIAVKGISGSDLISSRVYTLTSRVPSTILGTPWSDSKVGENESSGKDITSYVKIGENDISTYGLSALMYFDSSLNTKTVAKVSINGTPNVALTSSEVVFDLDSSFFNGFEDSSYKLQGTSKATIEVKDSVNLTFKASDEEAGITDKLESVVLSATDYVKERTINISEEEDKTVTVAVEKDRAVDFEPKVKTGYALDNTAPFSPSGGISLTSNGKYRIIPSSLQSDYTLSVKTVEMSVEAKESSELEFNVWDTVNVKKQIPLTIKGYILQDSLPASSPRVTTSVVGGTEEQQNVNITNNSVGGRGFSVSVAKDETGVGLILTISPKSTLNASYQKSTIKITLPKAYFKNATQDVVVSGDNIDNTTFVVYPSYSVNSQVELIKGVDNSALTLSPEIVITSDTKWKSVSSDGEDITDKVLIGDSKKPLSTYSVTARLKTSETENGGKTARILIEGTPSIDTTTKSEPITLKINASMLEGYEDLSSKEINCYQSGATFLVNKSVELKFKTPELVSDNSNENERKLKSVLVKADGLKDKEYTLENGEVSVFVKEGKNVTFKPTYESGYAPSSTPFTSSLSAVSIVATGDLNFPYRVVLQNVALESSNITILCTSSLKTVTAVSQDDLTFSASSSTSSDVKTLQVSVDGYELRDSVDGIEPLVYALINSEKILLSDVSNKDLIGGTGFNVSMQKRTDGVVGLTIRIAPKGKLTKYLELSKIEVVIPSSAFKNESDEQEGVVVRGLDDTHIVIYPSVIASGTAVLVQNVSTNMLNTAPVVSLSSDAVWNIQSEGEDIKSKLFVNSQNVGSALMIDSALLLKDETDSTGKTALIKFNGTPLEAIQALTSLTYALDTSYFVGTFTEDISDFVSVSVPSNSSRIIVYPSKKVTFNVPAADGSNDDERMLKSVNIKQSENIKGRTLTLDDSKEASTYVQMSKALSAILTFEDGYSLPSSGGYNTEPVVNISGRGTEGSPFTIDENVLVSDTTITISSIKRGLTLSRDDAEEQKGVEYKIGDTSDKSYKFKISMVGYSKASKISGTPRVMIRKDSGDVVEITSSSVGGVGFNVTSDTTSLTDGFYITISPKARLTSTLPNGTIVVYIPSTYIDGATSEIEVVGGEALRSFNIYPSLKMEGNVSLIKGIDTDNLLDSQTFKLTSETAFNEVYMASSREVTTSPGEEESLKETYIVQNTDVSSFMRVGNAQNDFMYYGLKAILSLDNSDSSKKTAIITITGASTKTLTLSDVSIALPAAYFKDFASTDTTVVDVSSSSKMDIRDSVPLIFKKNTTSEDKGKLTKVTVLSTDRIKEVSHTLTSTEDTFETRVESSATTRFVLEYEKGYYIDTNKPFTITPSVEITNVDDALTTFEIPQSTLESSTIITVDTVKQQVIMDGVLEGYFDYFIGDSADTKLVISSYVTGLVIKDNIMGLVPTTTLDINGVQTDIGQATIGGVGFNTTIEKRTERDGFIITLSPKGPITESLIESLMNITLPKSMFVNATEEKYDLYDLDTTLIIYPSITATGSVNVYYSEEIPEDTIVTLTSETPWSTVVIGNELDITDLICIGSYNGKKLKDYGETLKAILSIDMSDAFRKTALVKFSGVPQVLQKEPIKVLFDFTPNLFSGFEGEDFLLDPTSFVEFSVIESPNRNAIVNSEDASDITYNVSSVSESDERVFRIETNGYTLADNIEGVVPHVYLVQEDDETVLTDITDSSVGGAGFNVSMAKSTLSASGVNITISPKGELTTSLPLSKIRVVIPSSAFKNEKSDVIVRGFENTNIAIYPAVNASGTVKFVQNISHDLLNDEPVVTLVSTSPWSSNIPLEGKEIKDIVSLENDASLLSLFGDDFSLMLSKDEGDISGKTAIVKFSGTPVSSLSELTTLNYDFDTSYFDEKFTKNSDEKVKVKENTSKIVVYPSHKITIKASSEDQSKGKLSRIKVLKSENTKECSTVALDSSKQTSFFTEDSKEVNVVLEFESAYSLDKENPYVASPEIEITGLGTTGSPMKIGEGLVKSDTEIIVSSVQKSIYLASVTQGSETIKGIEYSVGDGDTKSFTFNITVNGYEKSTSSSKNVRVGIKQTDESVLDITSSSVGGVGFNVETDTTSTSSGIKVTISPKEALTSSLPTGSVVLYVPSELIKDENEEIEVVSGDEYRSFKILPSLMLSGSIGLVKDVAISSLKKTQVLTLTSETPFNNKTAGLTNLVKIGESTLKDYGSTLKATFALDSTDETNKTATLTITGTPTKALLSQDVVSISIPLSYFKGFASTETKRITSVSDAKADISDSITLTISKNTSDEDKGKIKKITITSATSLVKGASYNITSSSSGVIKRVVEKNKAHHLAFEYEGGYFIDDTTPFSVSASVAINRTEGKLKEYDIPENTLTENTTITVNTMKQSASFDSDVVPSTFNVGDSSNVKSTMNLLLHGLKIKEDITGIEPTVSVNGDDITESLGGKGFNVSLSKREDGKNGFTLEFSPKGTLTESLVSSALSITLPSSLFENATDDINAQNSTSKIVIYPLINATGSVEITINKEIESGTTIKFTSETVFNAKNVSLNGDLTTRITIGDGSSSVPLTDYGKGLSAKLSIDKSDESGKTALVTFTGTAQKTLSDATIINFNMKASYFDGFDKDNTAIITNSSALFMIAEPQGDPIPLITVNGKDLTHSSMKDSTLRVTVPESDAGKDLYLVISNPQYDSLPSPKLSGYDTPTSASNMISEYMYSPFMESTEDEAYCDTPRMEEEFQRVLEEEQYALMTDSYSINGRAANVDYEPTWKNPYADLKVGEQVYLNDEKYLTPSTPEPKPGLYRTAVKGYEKVPATLRFRRKVSTPNGEKELLIVVEDDVWKRDLSYIDSQITRQIDDAFVESVANAFLKNGEDDLYGTVGNCYGQEWGNIPNADRVKNYYISKRNDGTTYSENGIYIGVTNQIVLFFGRLDGVTTEKGGTLGYFSAAHLRCNSTSTMFSNQAICLLINAFYAAYNLDRCESTCAHEFQHAIHNFQRDMRRGYDPNGEYITSMVNSNHESWLNEMFSTLVQDAVCDILDGYGPAYEEANGLAKPGTRSERVPSYFTAQRYGVTDWRRIQNTYSPNNTAITYGLVYSFGSYIVRNYGIGFIKNYLASNEKEFESSADMPSKNNSWSNSKSNALNMLIKAIQDSDPKYKDVTWEDVLQGWAAAILLSDQENAQIPYKLLKNNGSDYWWRGIYEYGIKVPSINYFNYNGPATMWEGADRIRTTGPLVFNSALDRTYDKLPQGNEFYGNTNTYVLLGKGLTSGTHTYTVDGDSTYLYELVLK